MKKKIIGVFICTLVLTGVFTTTAASMNILNNREIHRTTISNKGCGSIEVILKAEQGENDRTWNIKFCVKNTGTEDITVRTGPTSANSWIEKEPDDQIELVYHRIGPNGKLTTFYPFPRYPWTKTITAGDEIQLDEYTFYGKSNVPRSYREGLNWILPEREYYLSGRFMYKLTIGGHTQNVFTDEPVIINLGKPPKSGTKNLQFLSSLIERFSFLTMVI
jgi:hypothetical protein